MCKCLHPDGSVRVKKAGNLSFLTLNPIIRPKAPKEKNLKFENKKTGASPRNLVCQTLGESPVFKFISFWVPSKVFEISTEA